MSIESRHSQIISVTINQCSHMVDFTVLGLLILSNFIIYIFFSTFHITDNSVRAIFLRVPFGYVTSGSKINGKRTLHEAAYACNKKKIMSFSPQNKLRKEA